MKNTSCEHLHTTRGELFAASGSVGLPPYSEENQAAQGGLTYAETCDDCGATRQVNQNQIYREFGAWKHMTPPQVLYDVSNERLIALVQAGGESALIAQELLAHRANAYEARINEILATLYTPIERAAWWRSPQPCFGGRRPREMLLSHGPQYLLDTLNQLTGG